MIAHPLMRLALELQRQANRAFADDLEAKWTSLRTVGKMANRSWQFEEGSYVLDGKRPRPPGHWPPDRSALIRLLSRTYQHRARRLDMGTGIVKPLPKE